MRNRTLALLVSAVTAIPVVCLANAGVPGPLMHFGAMNTGIGLWWLAISMFTCITVEGLIYQITRVFSRPYLASFILNTVSLFAGVPLAFVGALVDFVLTATALTVVTETLVALSLIELRMVNGKATSGGRTAFVVLGANIFSNILLLAELCIATSFYPPRYALYWRCQRNIYAIREAAFAYAENHNLTEDVSNTVHVALQDLRPYLKDEKLPVCPLGGIYTVTNIWAVPSCSHTRTNKPLSKREMKLREAAGPAR